ncbi:MAG: stage II sporulation protein M [Candidatus Woesearchaeota archaeon]
MVFEQLFRERWLEKKPRHAFLLAVICSLIGIVSALFIFGSNPGLMSVAFTSLLLLPTLNILLSHEENVEIRENKLSLHMLFKDHKDIFEIYIFLFLGIFTAYSLIALLSPHSQAIFTEQLAVAGLAGSALNPQFIKTVLLNNLAVLFWCFALSLVYGAGSILFLTWNASAWGVIFGYIARHSAASTNQSPLIAFAITILPILPHMITEAASYISAAIVGGVVSKAALREDLGSKKFNHVITDALIFCVIALVLVFIAAIIESLVF